MALYETLKPLMQIWYAYQLTRGADVPHPRTSSSVAVGDGDAARVLLIGNGPCHGWGVVSHTLALAGGIAGAVAQGNARGARVDYVGEEVMNLAAAVAWLGRTDLRVYDAVVVIVGINDAVRLTPPTVWRRSLVDLLDRLRSGLRPEVRVALAGMQPVRSIPAYRGPLGSIAQKHAHRLTDMAREVVAERLDIDFFALSAPRHESGRPYGSPAIYREWGSSAAAALAPRLGLVRAPVAPAVTDADVVSLPDEIAVNGWSGLRRAVDMSAASSLSALEQITEEARERFGVRIASISLVDGDRLRYVGHGGAELPVSVPLDLTHCSVVVDEGEPLVVPRSSSDERFSGSPLIDLTHMEFYAGHPLVSSTGDSIGSFCIMHPFARSASSVDLEALQSLALRAQDELWKLEQSVPPAEGQIVAADELST